MKERPILFSTEMVQAILDGRKTQTRRVVKPQPPDVGLVYSPSDAYWVTKGTVFLGKPYWRCPYGIPGDRLWVREMWAVHPTRNKTKPSELPQTLPVAYRTDDFNHSHFMWRPSIFMPRWASRIMLEVTGVRVERVQDIGESDSISEGVTALPDEHHLTAFVRLWDSFNAKRGYSWESNPWVWMIKFKVLEPR